MEVHQKRAEPWTVTLIDTGDNSMTGGRLGRVANYVKDEDAFCFTYGDGLSDVNITKLIAFHKEHGKDATLTSVYPPGRFGALDIQDNQIKKFTEKPKGDGAWVNGGFFVLNKKIFNYLSNQNCIWEKEPLEKIAKDKQLSAYKHSGFWHAMDTLRDKNFLEEIWSSKKVPWKIWDDK